MVVLGSFRDTYMTNLRTYTPRTWDTEKRQSTKPKNQLARAIRVLIRQIYIKIKIKMQTGDYGAGFAILVPVRDGIIRWSNPWNSNDLGM